MTAQHPTTSTAPATPGASFGANAGTKVACTVTAIGAAITVIVVHAGDSHPQGAPLRRHLLDGEWPLHQRYAATIAAYLQPLQVLVAVAHRITGGVRRLEVIDVRWITGHTLMPGNRVRFETVPAPSLSHLLGAPSPAPWLPGQAWPVKVISLPMAPSATRPATGRATPRPTGAQGRSAA